MSPQAVIRMRPGCSIAPHLRVSAASPEHPLAMKVVAARRRDAEDVLFLVKHLGLSTVEQVLALCVEIFPDEPVPRTSASGSRRCAWSRLTRVHTSSGRSVGADGTALGGRSHGLVGRAEEFDEVAPADGDVRLVELAQDEV